MCCWWRPTTAWSSSTPASESTTAPTRSEPGGAGPVHHPACVRVHRNAGPPARPPRLPPRRCSPHRAHPLRQDHVGGISGFPASADSRHLCRSVAAFTTPTRVGRFQVRPTSSGRRSATSSNTTRRGKPGEVSRRPRSSSTSLPASCWSRCPATPGATPASRSMPATAGCCTAGTRSTIRERWRTARVPRLSPLEPVLAFDRKRVRDNHARLSELYERREPDLLMVCAHDASLYEHAKATA